MHRSVQARAWDIDRDAIRGREFDFTKKFLLDGLSSVDRLTFLGVDERRLLSQIQGRSYANIFGLVERYIGAKMLEVSRDHGLGDQVALEALVRMTDEELKHQELFRRIETMIGAGMPTGYSFLPQPNDGASVVLGKSTWSVLALTCLIELSLRRTIGPASSLTANFRRCSGRFCSTGEVTARDPGRTGMGARKRKADAARDAAVDDDRLVGAVDGILQAQSAADTHYFVKSAAVLTALS